MRDLNLVWSAYLPSISKFFSSTVDNDVRPGNNMVSIQLIHGLQPIIIKELAEDHSAAASKMWDRFTGPLICQCHKKPRTPGIPPQLISDLWIHNDPFHKISHG